MLFVLVSYTEKLLFLFIDLVSPLYANRRLVIVSDSLTRSETITCEALTTLPAYSRSDCESPPE